MSCGLGRTDSLYCTYTEEGRLNVNDPSSAYLQFLNKLEKEQQINPKVRKRKGKEEKFFNEIENMKYN